MFSFLMAEPFFGALDDRRVAHIAGPPGRGKTSLAVCISYMLHQRGRTRHTIANIPLAWATVVSECPPVDFCAILDEGGLFFDARSFQDKGQGRATLAIIAMPRHINAYALVSSTVSPDARFRALQVRHIAGISGVVDVYEYGYVEGTRNEQGLEGRRPWFILLNRAALWRGSLVYPQRYGIPDESTVAVISHFTNSCSSARATSVRPAWIGGEGWSMDVSHAGGASRGDPAVIATARGAEGQSRISGSDQPVGGLGSSYY